MLCIFGTAELFRFVTSQDMFLIPTFVSSLLKTCQTGLKCFVYIRTKTICLTLRVTVQKLSAELGVAHEPMYLHVSCGHVPVQLIAVDPAASLFLACLNQV